MSMERMAEEHERKITTDVIDRAIKSANKTITKVHKRPDWWDQNDRLFALEQRVERLEQALKEKSEREDTTSDRTDTG